MTSIEAEDFIEAPNELASLKARADLLGLNYHPSIGLDKLRDKVTAAMNSEPEEVEVPVVKAESEDDLRRRQKLEASELVRVRVSCMNPNKKEWEGEIFTVGNSLVGTFKKYVPFNAEDGWHVPRIIYNQLIERQCQIFVSAKDSRGNSTRSSKIIKEFAVEVMPALNQAELDEMARRQAMSHAID